MQLFQSAVWPKASARCQKETSLARGPRIPAPYLAILAALLGCSTAMGVGYDFESAEPSWRLAENDCHVRLQLHQRTFDESHSGRGSEFFRFWSNRGGTEVLLAHPVTPALVIDELAATLWVKSPRSGFRLSVRVVLPRSRDPETGQPLSSLLANASAAHCTYDTPGSWKQLRVDDLGTLLERKTRLLRHVYGDVDPAEAYIDTVVLNAYSGGGDTELWLDDLELGGFVGRLDTARPPAPPAAATAAGTPRTPRIRVRGSLLEVDGKPFFVRAIEWSGEPFRFLASAGINVILMKRDPSEEEVREAERLNVWIVTPPPPAGGVGAAGNGLHRRSLSWRVGAGLTEHDVLSTAASIAAIRNSTRELAIPIVADVAASPGRFAEYADLLQLSKSPIGTSFELADCCQWWQARGGTIRPIKPFWATIQTELTAAHQIQIQRLSQNTVTEMDVDPEQIWLQGLLALAGGARGIVFQSTSRVDGQDRSSRRRAAAIRVMNHYLDVVESWSAAGVAGKPIRLRTPGFFASTLEIDQARLLIVCRSEAEQQYVVGSGNEVRQLSVPLPNRHVADQAWEFSSGRLRRLPAGTASNGTITLPDPGLFSLVAFTNDDRVVNYLGLRTDAARKAIGEELKQIASLQLDETQDVLRALIQQHRGSAEDASILSSVAALIEEARRLGYTGDAAHAVRILDAAVRRMRKLRKDNWRAVTLALPSPISTPLCTSFRTLPAHWELAGRMQRVAWGPNAVAGGRFEDLKHLLSTGWKQSTGSSPGIESKVELSLESPRTGRHALKLQAWSPSPPSYIETWPVWVTSSSIPVRAGQVVRIQGAARIAERISGSADGLLIFDTMTGVDLATRIRSTRGWHEFYSYRAVPSSGEMSVVIALTGVGEVYLDDLEVHVGTLEPQGGEGRQAGN